MRISDWISDVCSSDLGGTPCGRSLAPTATRNEWPLAIIALVWKISTGTITRLPLPTACTESCVYGCQGWIIWPSSLRERLSSTMRSDAVWMPLVSDLATPFSSTSSTRTDSDASAAVVDSHTSASIGPLMYMSSASGAEIGTAHVCTPDPNAPHVCRLL